MIEKVRPRPDVPLPPLGGVVAVPVGPAQFMGGRVEIRASDVVIVRTIDGRTWSGSRWDVRVDGEVCPAVLMFEALVSLKDKPKG